MDDEKTSTRYAPAARAKLTRSRSVGPSNLRKLSRRRKLFYALAGPLFGGLVRLWWMSCSVRVIGDQSALNQAARDGKPVIPCYWHQQHLFCARHMLGMLKQGLRVGFLVSPSVDGEVPARLVAGMGARVIRGSSTRTGAQALRQMYQVVARDGVSPVTTVDGPKGPAKVFKEGAINLAGLTGAPMIPIACAARRAWYLDRWDRFLLPRPFTRVTVAIGAAVSVPKKANEREVAALARDLERQIAGLEAAAAADCGS